MAAAGGTRYHGEMDGETLLLLSLGVVAPFIVWGWRRIDVFSTGTNYHSRAPLQPCWTEEIGHDGRYFYGRAQCANDDLMEMDVRAARGDYQIPLAG